MLNNLFYFFFNKRISIKKSVKNVIDIYIFFCFVAFFLVNMFTFDVNDYNSNDGMLTAVWGPSQWHFLHTMSFNYPVHPTMADKQNYRNYVLSLRDVLPCGKCRKNLRKNLAKLPLLMTHMASRDSFSRYIYALHEVVNKMLHKKSGLTYEVVRERYEHFRARCATTSTSKAKTCAIATGNAPSTSTKTSTGKKGTPESGCVVPMYGEKARCIIKIVPQKQKGDTFQVDKKCVKKHLGTMFSMKKENPRKRRLHTIRRRRRV